MAQLQTVLEPSITVPRMFHLRYHDADLKGNQCRVQKPMVQFFPLGSLLWQCLQVAKGVTDENEQIFIISCVGLCPRSLL